MKNKIKVNELGVNLSELIDMDSVDKSITKVEEVLKALKDLKTTIEQLDQNL